MYYYHQVTDEKGTIKESLILNDKKERFSLKCHAEIIGGNYQIIMQPKIK